jgi:lambda repressor-like predicted transcriptional regulator
MEDRPFNLGAYIKHLLHSQGRTLTWLARQTGINYKSLHDKVTYDRFKAYDLLLVAKVLDIDLNELKKYI